MKSGLFVVHYLPRVSLIRLISQIVDVIVNTLPILYFYNGLRSHRGPLRYPFNHQFRGDYRQGLNAGAASLGRNLQGVTGQSVCIVAELLLR